MLVDSKSKMNWQETSVMQYFDCDKVFCLTWFILLHKSLLVVVLQYPFPRRTNLQVPTMVQKGKQKLRLLKL